MKFIVLFMLFLSCSPKNYSVHERNMQLQHKGMIKHDLIMKGKMTKLRKQGVRQPNSLGKGVRLGMLTVKFLRKSQVSLLKS